MTYALGFLRLDSDLPLHVTGRRLCLLSKEPGRQNQKGRNEMIRNKRIRVQIDDRAAAGWSFVMENYRSIERLSSKVCRQIGTGLEAGELLNATILHIVENFRFDPTRGSAGAYIFWAVREIGQRDCRQRMIGRTEEVRSPKALGEASEQSNSLDLLPATRLGTAKQMEQHAEISLALRGLTPEEKEAIRLKAGGFTDSEAQEISGISLAGLNQRIYRARLRFDAEERA